MADRRSIVRQWRERGARVLVTLVRVEGSSYRRTGAHLLVGPGGSSAGSISGGCLEAEVVRKAEWMVRDGAVIRRYSTLFDDTAEIPFGLGCGGVVDLLLEPAETPEGIALLSAMAVSLEGQERTVITWLPADGNPLRRLILGPKSEIHFASAALSESEIASVASAHASGTSPAGVSPALDKRLYVERLRAPQRLILLGAGEDARPIVTMAAMLGWRATVVDGRPYLATRERFPDAERTVTGSSIDALGIGPGDAIIVMTHSYEQDRAFLTALLAAKDETRAGYIGVLGARHRSSLLVSEAAAATGLTVAECCARLWAPVGLDLGGDGPEAIALAVIAEVQAWTQGRLARSRRLNAEGVAEQIARGGGAQYLQTCAIDLAHAQSLSQSPAEQGLVRR